MAFVFLYPPADGEKLMIVWRSRFAGLTRVRNGSNYGSAGPLSSVGVSRAWADCPATSVVIPCRTQSNAVPK